MATIPREALLEMLRERVWSNVGRPIEGREDYSLEVDDETCYTQVGYRGARLYPTADEAILGFWREHLGGR